MFTKKNYILFLVLIILVLGAWAYVVPYQKWQANRDKNSINNPVAGVNISAVDKIEITDTKNGTHYMKKNDTGWVYGDNNWPAEQAIVDNLEKKITDMVDSELEVVSINPQNKPNFGITDASPVMTLYQGDGIVGSFIIGSPARDYQSTYIGKKNDNNTYAIPDIFVGVIDYKNWPDKTITALNTEDVDTIIFSYPYQTISLTNTPAATGEVYWRSEKPYILRLSKDKVESFLDKAGHLESIALPEQNDPNAGFDKPELTLELKGKDIAEKLIIGAVDNQKQYYVKEVSSGRVFLINEKDKDALFKQIKDFQ